MWIQERMANRGSYGGSRQGSKGAGLPRSPRFGLKLAGNGPMTSDFMGHALQFKDVAHWQPLAAPPSPDAPSVTQDRAGERSTGDGQ